MQLIFTTYADVQHMPLLLCQDEAYLSHGDKRELAILNSVIDLSSIGLNLLAGGVTREQDEEDGGA